MIKGVKYVSLIMVAIFCWSCDNNRESSNSPKIRAELPLSNDTLEWKIPNQIEFLENLVDFIKYKKSKNVNNITTSVCNGENYYYKPGVKNTVFYTYNFIHPNLKHPKKADQAIVLKYGINKHIYNDENEILLELRIFNSDPNLGQGDLVGMSKVELESLFGLHFLAFDSTISYSYKNRLLILNLKESKVQWYRYLKLNTDKIDGRIIEEILKD